MRLRRGAFMQVATTGGTAPAAVDPAYDTTSIVDTFTGAAGQMASRAGWSSARGSVTAGKYAANGDGTMSIASAGGDAVLAYNVGTNNQFVEISAATSGPNDNQRYSVLLGLGDGSFYTIVSSGGGNDVASLSFDGSEIATISGVTFNRGDTLRFSLTPNSTITISRNGGVVGSQYMGEPAQTGSYCGLYFFNAASINPYISRIKLSAN